MTLSLEQHRHDPDDAPAVDNASADGDLLKMTHLDAEAAMDADPCEGFARVPFC